jgi:hypothetical protein
MPSFLMPAQDFKNLEAPVREVSASTGTVVVTEGEKTTVVGPGENYDAGDTPSLALYSPDGANVTVLYTTEAPEAPEPAQRASGVSAEPKAAERGDTGGQTGSYESRTLEELNELAAERGVKGHASLNKKDLIAALRGEK